MFQIITAQQKLLINIVTLTGAPTKAAAPDSPGATVNAVKRCLCRRTIACKLRGPRRLSLLGDAAQRETHDSEILHPVIHGRELEWLD